MRFLQRKSDGSFELTPYMVKNVPKYAVLSHTWLDDDQEVTYEDFINQNAQLKPEGLHQNPILWRTSCQGWLGILLGGYLLHQ